MDQTCLPLMSHVSHTNLRYLVYPTVTQQLMGRLGYLLPYYLISNDCAAVKWAAQIHLHKWMRPQRTHFKRTFHLWQQLPCNSPRWVSQLKAKRRHRNASWSQMKAQCNHQGCRGCIIGHPTGFSVGISVLCCLFSCVWTAMTSEPRRTSPKHTGLIWSWRDYSLFQCLKNRKCLFLVGML